MTAKVRDVAALAGVSVGTVSNVLNRPDTVRAETRRRVEAAISQLGFVRNESARQLRAGSSRLLAFVLPDITNPFFAELVRALGSAAQARGYMTLLCETDSDPAKELAALQLLAAHQADGVILAPTGPAEMYFAPPLSTFRKPLMMVDRVVPGAPFNSVAIDNHRAAFELTQYLLALGHTRVGIVAGTPHLSNTIERLAGFRDALAARGLQVAPSHIVQADFREDRARELCRRLLAGQDRPTALFVSNNQMLIGTMQAITDLSLACPDDISLAAIDDFPWAATFTPKLTTQRQPIAGLAEHAVRLLHARMREGHMQGGRRAGETVVLRTELVIRKSCAPPKPGTAVKPSANRIGAA